MVWLVTHIWVGLALAALSGLLFGWALRGLNLKAKARNAMVQRDIALTELEQSRLEIDQLYAAQSKGIGAATQAGDETLRRELETREQKLQVLGRELSSSRNELEALKAQALASASAVAAGVAAASTTRLRAAQIAPEVPLDAELNLNDASLEWRNRYLASRVRTLEAKTAIVPVVEPSVETAIDTDALDAAMKRAEEAEAAIETLKQRVEDDKRTAIAAALAASAATAYVAHEPVSHAKTETGDDLRLIKQSWQATYLRQRLAGLQAAGAVMAEATSLDALVQPAGETPADMPEEAVDTVAAEKQAWQNQYLRQRLAYLEARPPKDRAAQSVEDIAQSESQAGIEAVPMAEPDTGSDPGALEQEMARLRWRNRYLEGRLAYIDGDAPKSDAEIAAQSPAMAQEAAPEAPEAVDDEEDVADIEPVDAGLSSAMSEEDDAPEEDSHTPPLTPAEAVLAALNAGHSDDLDKPDGLAAPKGKEDDLTLIKGVGESTAKALNAMGIWHFYQIAGWTRENIAWVDQHLGTPGRVEADDWILQAGALSLGASLD